VRKEDEGFAYAGYLIRIRSRRTILDPGFLNLVLSSQDVRVQIELEARSTSGVNNINSEEVRALEFVLPPIDEQKEILHRVEAMFVLADRLQARYERARAHVGKVTQSVLAKAFRGELVPTEAELARREGRSYETAEQLLERIREHADERRPRRVVARGK
jgi:type I restriction enzyme S subunit